MEVQLQLIAFAGVIVTGIFTWVHIQTKASTQRKMKQLNMQYEEQKRETDRQQKEAEVKIIQVQTDAQQVKGTTESLLAVIQAYAKANESAATERAASMVLEEKHVEALNKQTQAIEKNTAMLEARNTLLDDVEKRLGDFTNATKKQSDTISAQMETTNESLKTAIKKMDDIPADIAALLEAILDKLPKDIEAKLNPLLDKLSNLEQFADDVQIIMRDEIEKIKDIVIEAFQLAQANQTAA